MLENLIFLLTFGTSFSVLTVAFGIFTERKKKTETFIRFSFFLLWGIYSLLTLYGNSSLHLQYPYFIFAEQPIEFLFGPLVYYYIMSNIETKIKNDKLKVILFAPAVIALFYYSKFYLQSPEVKTAFLNFKNYDAFFFSKSLFLLFKHGAGPWLIFCLALLAFHASRILSKKSVSLLLHTKIIVFYLVVWSMFIIGYYFAILFDLKLLLLSLTLLFNCLLITAYFLEKYFSDFFLMMSKDASETKYKKSRISGINTDAVIQRIHELIELENIYLDENISLNKLSGMLNISPYQLSEIINNVLHSNFNAFINKYRIDAAKRLLVENENSGIMHIAFQCGFNSKSVFNNAFFKLTGMTPSNYRQKFKKHGTKS